MTATTAITTTIPSSATTDRPPLWPGQSGADGSVVPVTLGVLGGGQLGRMFVQAAQANGYATGVLDPDTRSPAGQISHHHICTDYQDAAGLAQLVQSCAAITTEFENIPADVLHTLAAERPVAPQAHAVAIAQNRILEKSHLALCGVPVAPYAVVETPRALLDVADHLLPGVLKTARMGYDGKGQVSVATRAELASAWTALRQVPCVLEKRLSLAAECSVIAARSHRGDCVYFAPQLNLHRQGILAVTRAYAGNLPPHLVQQAVDATLSIANELAYVGVLCVEFFVLADDDPCRDTLGALVVNEIAPRPHNSGHYTIDACDVSQFDLQVRTLAGLPLVQPRQHSAAVMINLLGTCWAQCPADALTRVLALPGVHLHLYDKQAARLGRKMGHLTFTAATANQAEATAQMAARLLGIDPWD